MKRLMLFLSVLFLLPLAHGQNINSLNGNTITQTVTGAPSGNCFLLSFYVNASNGDLYDCPAGSWVKVGSSSGGFTAGGDLAGTSTSQTVIGINGTSLTGLATGITRNTTATGAISSAELSGDATTSGSNVVSVVATHLGSALPVNQGGTGTTSTLAGLMRGSASAMTAAELSADVTTSGSNAATVVATHLTNALPTTQGGTGTGALVGGIIGAYINASTGVNSGWFLSAVNSGTKTIVMPFNAWFRNLSVYMSAANAVNAAWQFAFGTNNTADAAFNAFSIPTNAAAGAYQGIALPRFSPMATSPIVSATALSSAANGGQLRGLTAEITGSTSSIIGTNLNSNTVALSSTVYTGPSQIASTNGNATEGLVAVVVPYNATAKNLCVQTAGAQPASGSLVFTLRQNVTTSTSLVATVPLSGGAGPYCDNTHTVSLTAGDKIDFQIVNNATNVSAAINGIAFELAPSGSATGMIVYGLGTSTVASGSAVYWQSFAGGASTGTEANVKFPMPRAVTMKNLNCYVTTAPGTNSDVITVYKNGSPTALTVTLTTGFSTPGTLTDSTHTVSYAALDDFTLQTSQSSGSNPAISSCSVEVD